MNGATEVWRVSAVVAPAASAGVWAAREPGRGFKVCGSGSAPRPPTASLPPPPSTRQEVYVQKRVSKKILDLGPRGPAEGTCDIRQPGSLGGRGVCTPGRGTSSPVVRLLLECSQPGLQVHRQESGGFLGELICPRESIYSYAVTVISRIVSAS